jgi:hypothetical protein
VQPPGNSPPTGSVKPSNSMPKCAHVAKRPGAGKSWIVLMAAVGLGPCAAFGQCVSSLRLSCRSGRQAANCRASRRAWQAGLAGSGGRTAVARLVCYLSGGSRQSEPASLARQPSGRAAAGGWHGGRQLSSAANSGKQGAGYWQGAISCGIPESDSCIARLHQQINAHRKAKLERSGGDVNQ